VQIFAKTIKQASRELTAIGSRTNSPLFGLICPPQAFSASRHVPRLIRALPSPYSTGINSFPSHSVSTPSPFSSRLGTILRKRVMRQVSVTRSPNFVRAANLSRGSRELRLAITGTLSRIIAIIVSSVTPTGWEGGRIRRGRSGESRRRTSLGRRAEPRIVIKRVATGRYAKNLNERDVQIMANASELLDWGAERFVLENAEAHATNPTACQR